MPGPLTASQRAAAEEILHLCEFAANRFARRSRGQIPRDEFLSAAYAGLVMAAASYDESRGVPLWGFAAWRIEGACLDLIRQRRERDWRRDAPLVFDVLDGAPPPGEALAAEEEFDRLLSGLDARGAFLIRQIYGPAGWRMATAAAALGLHWTSTERYHDRALARVRDIATGRGLAWGRSRRPDPPIGRPARRMVEYQGETRPIAEWAARTGLPPTMIHIRLRRGWSVERTMTTAPEVHKRRRDAS